MQAFLYQLKNGLRYSLYLIFHPFDGFWELKREKRGNFFSALLILFLLVVTTVMRGQLTGFVVDSSPSAEKSIVNEIIKVVFPFFVWCVSHWCVTTLLEGEGTLKDIAITSSYALTPLVLIGLPLIIFSNMIITEEKAFYMLFFAVSIIWTLFLLIIGIMTVHQFTVKKTIATIFLTVCGMLIILFMIIIFISILQQLISFIRIIYNEISMRR